jgi:serine/threonine-protein kinase
MNLAPATVINGRYELVSRIAQGGMGEVWRAKDIRLGRVVAVKAVHPHYLNSNPKALLIFQDEARAGACLLGEPNVIAVLDIVEHVDAAERSYFIVMEFVDGATLSRWIGEIAPKIDEVTRYYINVYIAWQLCRAMQSAHGLGILHRDMKPLNAFIAATGILKIGDFGLARFIEAVTRTHTVARSMSAAYAAPEQWREEKHGETTDVYQLGCTLYQLFTGVLPFDRSSLMALMTAHLTLAPKSAKSFVGHMSGPIDAAIISMMAKDPDLRCALWKLNDALSAILFQKFCCVYNVAKMSMEERELFYDITEIGMDDESDMEVIHNASDPIEMLQEGLALSVAGFTKFSIKVQPSAPPAPAPPPPVAAPKAAPPAPAPSPPVAAPKAAPPAPAPAPAPPPPVAALKAGPPPSAPKK